MPKTWLVARHEFSVTLDRLSYRIFAASVPVLAIVALVGITVFQAIASDGATGEESSASDGPAAVGYVDLTAGEDGRPLFTRFQLQGNTVFKPYLHQDAATQDLLAGRIDRYYVFGVDYPDTGIVHEVREQRAGLSFEEGSRGALHRFVLENLFEGQVEPDQLDRIRTPYRMVTVEVGESGAPAESDLDVGATLTFIAAGILLLVSGFTASGYLLQGLTEEKENRIMEVLLSSIKPEHMMFGKLLGL